MFDDDNTNEYTKFKHFHFHDLTEEEITKHKKNPSANKKKDIKNIKEKKEPENFEEEMKIYIDKEIK